MKLLLAIYICHFTICFVLAFFHVCITFSLLIKRSFKTFMDSDHMSVMYDKYFLPIIFLPLISLILSFLCTVIYIIFTKGNLFNFIKSFFFSSFLLSLDSNFPEASYLYNIIKTCLFCNFYNTY